jgi:anti-sigma factor ChrR (cupin superfamily)
LILKQPNKIPIVLNDIDLKWITDSIGIKVAVLQGDPSKKGPYTMRIVFPANWKIAPHWHDEIESITILKGTLYVGNGGEFLTERAVQLKEGGFGRMPVGVVHYAFTKEECIAQVHGMGRVKRYFK